MPYKDPEAKRRRCHAIYQTRQNQRSGADGHCFRFADHPGVIA
jgi:hypothetical protein